jgi:hypothetical protein
MSEVLGARSVYQIREELQDLIVGELLGPAGGEDEEVAEARLTERYMLGMLAPSGTASTAEDDDSLALTDEAGPDEGTPEPEGKLSFFPSSFGMTFTLDAKTTRLKVTPRWGRYKRERSQVATAEGTEPLVWRRYPMGGDAVPIDLAEGELGPLPSSSSTPEVVLRGRARRHDNYWLVTLFIVNGQQERKQLRDEAWLFQVGFEVEDPEGEAVFRGRPVVEGADAVDPDSLENKTLQMLYRDHVEFAVGHGVSIHANLDSVDPRRANRLMTTAVPTFEVPRTDPPTAEDIPELADAVVDMKTLAEAESTDLPAMLSPLVDAYEEWIERQEGRVGSEEARLDGFEDAVVETLDRCRSAAARIRTGIDLLGSDEDAVESFRFANRAMWTQRVHFLAAQERRKDQPRTVDEVLAELDVPENRSWRPFQIAFILLNLPALTDPRHPERRAASGLVDLLWFPTGGGKTEAYLGLIAYVFAIRRLQGVVAGHDGHEGVAAIMRYTLRLLTIQQFQRATALMCACEILRKELVQEDPRWGETPFRIGLWVGLRATPNTTDDAAAWLSQAKGATGYQGTRGGSPAQITFCPWCGSEIEAKRHLKVDPGLRRTFTFCGDRYGACPFTERQSPAEGLPVVVVDEEIYRLLPSLIIGTVDKFAQMPWRAAVKNLFGRVSARCERHGFRSPDLEDNDSHPRRGDLAAAKTVPAGPLRPPDLIIQDELHLIAGPLGSMVGLYETAIDRLCAWTFDNTEIRPKVIASTATVRRAAAQGHSLFWRGLDVFPPSGLDAADSFFALQREPNEQTPGRRYFGISAHGRQFKSALIRVYVAQMAAAQALSEKYGSAVDPYMTVVGYFNALRELGGMRRHVEDDVSSRLGRIDRRGLARRQRPIIEELTSRRSSLEIPRVLDHLSVGFVPDRPKDSPVPIDVLLATNMISVGIDVPRLGAMIVAGQPKATAEYIQATSRIGRAAPGLVLTVYGWARPRDLSHYERFEHYHATLYRHVEAMSVTPFAPRALDRGITALLVSLVRHLETTYNADHKAQDVDTRSALIQEIVAELKERAEGITSAPGIGSDVEDAVKQRLDMWAGEQSVTGRLLAYRGRKDGKTYPLLKSPGAARWDVWTCLTSLRDVEPGVNLLFTSDGLGDDSSHPYKFAGATADDTGDEPS